MRRFIKKIMIFIGIFVLINVIAALLQYHFIGNVYDDNTWTSSITYKIDRLIQINEPKIVLVGNSNVFYGFKSELLEKTFQMPVVNLGFHGGLGSKFHEDMIKGNINPGDIYIICDTAFQDSEVMDARLLWTVLEWKFEYWWLIDPIYYWDLIKAYPNYCFNSVIRKIELHTASTEPEIWPINKYGDLILERPNNETNVLNINNVPVPPSISTIGDEYYNRINELNAICKNNGATLYIAAYPIAYAGVVSNETKKSIQRFGQELDERLECKVISDYSDYLISYEYYYGNSLHLTDEGAIIRTEQLIKDLENAMK